MEFKLRLPDTEVEKITNKGLALRIGLSKGLKKGMLFLEGEAKKNFGGPGQLKVRTGHLRRSIRSNVIDRNNKLEAYIGSNVVYSAVHEFGYKPRNIPPRPYIKPAIENNRLKFEEIVMKELGKVMEGS